MQQLCLLLICFSTVVSLAITVAWETRRSYSLSRSLINDTEIFRWWLFDDGCSFSCLTCFFWTIITLFAKYFNYQIFLIIDPAILEPITFFIPPLGRRSQKSSGIISLSLEHVLKLRRDWYYSKEKRNSKPWIFIIT